MSDEHCRSESTVGDDGTKIREEACESAWCTCDTIAEVSTVGHLRRFRMQQMVSEILLGSKVPLNLLFVFYPPVESGQTNVKNL